jgi:hypothetical protein
MTKPVNRPKLKGGRKLIPLAGVQAGTFTVIEYAGDKRWLCRCNCGFERNILGYLIKKGLKPLCENCSNVVLGRQVREKTFVNRDAVAYLAGIIDGEGCIGIGKRGKYISPTLQITNTSEDLAKWLIQTCGGRCYYSVDKRPPRKPCWHSSVAGQIARDIIEAVQPFLIIKAKQAKLILENYGTVSRQPKRNSLGRLTCVMTEEEIALNRQLADQMRLLNRRGVSCH